ncbi:hypothetical protein PAPYR_12269 [Paratrimastix pyriformis]|uniref:Uncharacterized protein n=1 Tax=Paratrimastix pyriformis TaxID=342808 RepID=A0ABQ8U244_9EUKA|nr:hypothetical protein PAPYR_12269 [Paratrimastix pyriformis]
MEPIRKKTAKSVLLCFSPQSWVIFCRASLNGQPLRLVQLPLPASVSGWAAALCELFGLAFDPTIPITFTWQGHECVLEEGQLNDAVDEPMLFLNVTAPAGIEKLEPAPATSAAFEAAFLAGEIYARRAFGQFPPAGIMMYLPKEDWGAAQGVTRFLGNCSLGIFRVGDPKKFCLDLVDHGARPRRMIDFDRHPDSDSSSAKEMDYGVAPSSACRSQGRLSPLATPTATATAPPPAPLETPAAPLETPAAPLETPATPLETPATPLETPATPLETPAARLDAASDASSCSSRSSRPSRARVGRGTMRFILNNGVVEPTRTRSGQS